MVVAVSIATSSVSAQQDSMLARAVMPTPWSPTVIEPDSLDRAAFTNLGELLQARVPGLSVTRRGDGGTVIHLRGPSTALADNAPLLVVDDVRVSLTRSRLEEFDDRPSPLDDIDVEQVARVEILSGPAVAALYGTGAANGVIRISTRDPRATPTRWRGFAEAGAVTEPGTYPANYYRMGTMPGGGITPSCTRLLEATDECTPTGPVTTFNPLEDEGIVSAASLARVGGSVSAGTDLLAWTAGATFERRGSVTDDVRTQRIHARGAVRARISGNAELSLRGHWMDGGVPLLASPWRTSLRAQALLNNFRPGDTWIGFTRIPEPERNISRRGISLHGAWRTADWLRGDIVAGLDYSAATDLTQFGPTTGTPSLAYSEYVRQKRHDFTGRASVEASYPLGLFRARTIAFAEVFEHRRDDWFESPAGSSDPFRQAWLYNDQAATGLVMQQEFTADRAALRLGIRHEDLTAGNGDGWKTPWYPHIDVSLIPVRGRLGVLSDLRLHVAYGKAGGLPLLEMFTIAPPSGAMERKVEIISERQGGFEAGFLRGRADLSVTWYRKRTTDMLIPSFSGPPSGGYPYPPSTGPPSGGGELLNRGVEIAAHGVILQAPRVRWTVRAGYAHNHNEVIRGWGDLGGVSQRVFPGAPLGAYARSPIIAATDADGDGILETTCSAPQVCDVTFGNATEYLPPFPPTQLSVENEVRVGRARVAFLIDHRRGHSLRNETESSRCWRALCGVAYLESPSVDEQIKQLTAGFTSAGAYLEDATFTRLRELSLRLDLSRAWARALGGERLEVSLTGRNLATWTDYTGMDPEANAYGDNSLVVEDFASTPLPRSVSLRLTLER